MTKEMDSVDIVFNAFDKTKKLTKGKAFPFMCHCVVSHVSAKDIYDYLISNKFKVTHRTVVSWRREASIWLGLAQTGKGRISESNARNMRDDWHSKYGYPTYQDFFQGWKPAETIAQMAGNLSGESIPQTPANSAVELPHLSTSNQTVSTSDKRADVESKTQPKSTPKSRSSATRNAGNQPPILDLKKIKKQKKDETDYSGFIE